MAFKEVGIKLLSDLIVGEVGPTTGFARDSIAVAAGDYKLGTPVFRVKSEDPLAAYAPVTEAANLAVGNEYAIVFGNHYGQQGDFTAVAATAALPVNAVAIVGGPAVLKEYFIKSVSELADDDFASLKVLLRAQGIKVEDTPIVE